MALAYFALKLFRRNRRIRQKQKNEIAPDLKLDKPVNFPSDCNNICRICLNMGTIPIYGANNSSTIAKSIQTFGDVEIDVSDDFPKHICEDCYKLLENAILFRKSAKDSDKLLHQKKTEVEISNYSPMNRVDIADEDSTIDNQTNKVETKSFSCKLCKLNFETNEKYATHLNSKQHKKVRVQCKICRRLITANLYKRHLACHDSASHLVCEVCGKLFRKDNLIRHLQLHSFELPYKCQICPYRGRYVDSLKIHMRSHTGDKPFSCEECDLRFLTRSNLNRHLLTHKKERPFKCQECGRGFYTKRDLDAHFKSDHVGMKEYGCRVCSNKYGTRKALMRHELRVHKRDKMGKGRLPLYLQAEYQGHSNQHKE